MYAHTDGLLDFRLTSQFGSSISANTAAAINCSSTTLQMDGQSRSGQPDSSYAPLEAHLLGPTLRGRLRMNAAVRDCVKQVDAASITDATLAIVDVPGMPFSTCAGPHSSSNPLSGGGRAAWGLGSVIRLQQQPAQAENWPVQCRQAPPVSKLLLACNMHEAVQPALESAAS